MTYEELKTRDKKAHSALIALCEKLSRVSRTTARNDLKEDWGIRYNVTEKSAILRLWDFPDTIGGALYPASVTRVSLEFTDSHSGDRFYYSEEKKEWV